MWTLCEALLAGLSEREPKREDCATLAKSFGVGPRYWAQLDTPFREFIGKLVDPADVREVSGTTRYGMQALGDWADTIERAARAVFNSVLYNLSGSARELRASATAAQRFAYLLAALMAPIQQNPQPVFNKE
jgi:hypothetical protein